MLFASALMQGSELSILLRGTGLPGVWGAAWSPTLGFWDRGEQGVAWGVRLPKSASGCNPSSPKAVSKPCRAKSCRAEPLRLLRNALRVQSGWKKHPFGHARGKPRALAALAGSSARLRDPGARGELPFPSHLPGFGSAEGEFPRCLQLASFEVKICAPLPAPSQQLRLCESPSRRGPPPGSKPAPRLRAVPRFGAVLGGKRGFPALHVAWG